MKIVKQLGIVILSIIGMILIIALFVKKEYQVERSVHIHAEKSDVFNYLRSLRNHGDFAVWQKRDPNLIENYKGIDGEIGAVYSWKSDNEEVGSGEQEIVEIKLNERIDFELRFSEPMKTTANAYMTLEENEEGTKVTWGITGKTNWPFNIFFLFFDMDEAMGPDLKEGLTNLKVYFEENE